MKHNTELSFAAIVGCPKSAAAFQIGGVQYQTAVVAVDDGVAVVEVFEGCGEEVHRFAGDKMPALVRDWIARADAGEATAHDFLLEVATEGLKEIRERRAEPLMLTPTTATMLCGTAGRHNGGPWLGSAWKARLDADESIAVVGPMQSREACIEDLHRLAGSRGYIVTRIEERIG